MHVHRMPDGVAARSLFGPDAASGAPSPGASLSRTHGTGHGGFEQQLDASLASADAAADAAPADAAAPPRETPPGHERAPGRAAGRQRAEGHEPADGAGECREASDAASLAATETAAGAEDAAGDPQEGAGESKESNNGSGAAVDCAIAPTADAPQAGVAAATATDTADDETGDETAGAGNEANGAAAATDGTPAAPSPRANARHGLSRAADAAAAAVPGGHAAHAAHAANAPPADETGGHEGVHDEGEAPTDISHAATAPAAAAPEPQVPTTAATTAVATDAAFDRLAGNGKAAAPPQEPPADGDQRQPSGSGDHEAARADTLKAGATAGADHAPAQGHDTRMAVATGATPSRLAEFQTARAAFSSPGAADTPAADTTDRIVQSLRMQYQRGGGEAIVHIKPDHLGPLTVSLRVEQGTVHARVTADNPVVAEWIQANEQSLRDGLKSNGLQLDRLIVNRDPDPSGRTPQRDEQQAQREQRRRFNERRSTFEVTA